MSRRRLLLFPFPLQGHVTPMLHLATILHSKGFSITIIHTHHRSPDPTTYPHFTFHFIEDGLSDKAVSAPDTFSMLSMLNTNCLQPFRDCLSLVLSDSDEQEVAKYCLIADPQWHFVGAVADSFNLPRITLIIGCMTMFHVFDSLPMLREKGYFLTQEETKSDELVLEFPPIKVEDLPSEPFHSVVDTISKVTKSSLGIICDTFEELESSALTAVRLALPIPVFTIGPLHKQSQTCASCPWTQDHTSISWLNTKAPKSVVYVSFGSLATLSEVEFHEIAWGLANSMQPFLWVVRPWLIKGTEVDVPLPEGYIDIVGSRGHIVKWAPQLEVLAHPAVGGFWTHCGWNSTIESISEGVPMICLPFFAEQPINAKNVSDNWRTGLFLEKRMKREEIEQVIRRLMVEEEGVEMRSRAAALKEKASHCLMEGGSSYNNLQELTSYLLSL